MNKIRTFYSDRLISLVLFGSYARRENRRDSDIDLLIVLDDLEGKGRLKRQEVFVREIEMPLEELRSSCEKEAILVEASPLILNRKEAGVFLPIYLDMVEHHFLVVDRQGFMKKRIGEVRQQMQRWGSRRREIGGHWYWEIQPGLKWNEVIDYDK